MLQSIDKDKSDKKPSISNCLVDWYQCSDQTPDALRLYLFSVVTKYIDDDIRQMISKLMGQTRAAITRMASKNFSVTTSFVDLKRPSEMVLLPLSPDTAANSQRFHSISRQLMLSQVSPSSTSQRHVDKSMHKRGNHASIKWIWIP